MSLFDRILGGKADEQPPSPNEFRPGNAHLDFILENFQPLDEKTEYLVGMLPPLANALFRICTKEAEGLIKHVFSKQTRWGRSKMVSRAAKSALDLAITVYFNEVGEFLGPRGEVASRFADALLWQAVGLEPAEVTEEDIRSVNTQDRRGIHKYCLAGRIKYGPTEDSAGFLYGLEMGRAVTGEPDVLAPLLLMPASLLFRFDVKALVRNFLYAEKPDPRKREELEGGLEELQRGFAESL